MCRLYGFRSTHPTRVECSLVAAQNALSVQSAVDGRGLSNGDGWGIASYSSPEPTIHKRAGAAHLDLAFRAAASSVSSTTLMAHVRSATVGHRRDANAHPFGHGPWTFPHNGTLTALDHVGPRLEAETAGHLLGGRHGDTDSELIFLWLLSRMPAYGLHPCRPGQDAGALVALMADGVTRLAELAQRSGADRPAQLNFLMSDGPHLAASRWGNTLYWAERTAISDCAICGQLHTPDRFDTYRAVVVASEPITDELWREIPEGSIISVGADLGVHVHDLLRPVRAA
ncbi:MAG: class II glutamine amidotransferase [Acidimicrobiia bacterium]|nr:class II glutamine amidotransferase [Acidimicrobiia bacterium]